MEEDRGKWSAPPPPPGSLLQLHVQAAVPSFTSVIIDLARSAG